MPQLTGEACRVALLEALSEAPELPEMACFKLLEETSSSSANTSELERHVCEEWDMSNVNHRYDAVAAIGPRGTGQSTLLNELFGTSFPHGNEYDKFCETKGTWISKAGSANILVMDNEGCDPASVSTVSNGRGMAVSMMLAGVIIINIWEHDSYYAASVKPLLDQIRSLQKQFFDTIPTTGIESLAREFAWKDTQARICKRRSIREHFRRCGLVDDADVCTLYGGRRTLLLFVVRDHISTRPFETVVSGIKSKLDIGSASDESDMLDFEFVAIPHKTLEPGKFGDAVTKLRARFTDKYSNDSLFKLEYWKLVAADKLSGHLANFMTQYGGSTVSEADKTYPLVKCNSHTSIYMKKGPAEVHQGFMKAVAPLAQTLESGASVDAFSETIDKHYKAAKTILDGIGNSYISFTPASSKKLADIHKRVDDLSRMQAQNIMEEAMKDFSRQITEHLSKCNGDFDTVYRQLGERRKCVIQTFEKKEKESYPKCLRGTPESTSKKLEIELIDITMKNVMGWMMKQMAK